MRAREVQHRLTQPVRRAAVPVLRGNGRGLRVRFGESALTRAFAPVEQSVENAIIERLHVGDVFYDIGANIGWYSLLAARIVGPRGRVIAFEPSIDNAALVQHNAAVNHFANVTTVCAALTDEDRWMTFLDTGNLQGRLDKDDSHAHGERHAKAERKPVKRRIPVPVAKLDSWLAQTGQPAPTLVKIDVEGAEAGVLRGMQRTLAHARPTLVIELHGTREQVADELDAAGYQHAPIQANVPTREAPPLGHLLARPPAAPAPHDLLSAADASGL
jgi:FkbM family methyltransferase